MNRVKVIDFKIHAYYILDDRINMKNHAKIKILFPQTLATRQQIA